MNSREPLSKKHKIDLKLITSYWCNDVSPEWEDRFSWAFEKVDIDGVNKIGDAARTLLQTLALSYIDERTGSSIAAGPLENYINLIIKKQDANEAAYIVTHPILSRLLPYVWGEVDKLMPLAQRGKATSPIPEIDTGIQTLNLREVTCFWCKLASSKNTDLYDQHFEIVMEKLRNKATRKKVTDDLLLSAPDKKAEQYLLNEVISLL